MRICPFGTQLAPVPKSGPAFYPTLDSAQQPMELAFIRPPCVREQCALWVEGEDGEGRPFEHCGMAGGPT